MSDATPDDAGHVSDDDNPRPSGSSSVSKASTDKTLFQFSPDGEETQVRAGGSDSTSTAVDRFEWRELLGQGGMGAVYSAVDRYLERPVAIKCMLKSGDKEQRSRFIRESQLNGRLEHPNIGIVHELGFRLDATPYLVMRMLSGQTLAERIKELRQGADHHAGGEQQERTDTTSRTSVRAAAQEQLLAMLDVFRKVCDAVAYAHENGIIHRDLKPDNIMVGEFGEVTVLDWGLAKEVEGAKSTTAASPEREGSGASQPHPKVAGARINTTVLYAPTGSAQPPTEGATTSTTQQEQPQQGPLEPPRTADGKTLGTVGYMAPEQARGELEKIGRRSDIYSLGATLYTILFGRHPFEGDSTVNVLMKVGNGEPPPFDVTGEMPWQVSWELRAVVRKAMSHDPESRYESANALKKEITRYLDGQTLEAATYYSSHLVARWVHRNRIRIGAAAAALLLLGVGVIFYLVNVTKARDHATEQHDLAVEREQEAQRQRARADDEARRAEEQARVAGRAQHVAEQESQRAQEALRRLRETESELVRLSLLVLDRGGESYEAELRELGHATFAEAELTLDIVEDTQEDVIEVSGTIRGLDFDPSSVYIFVNGNAQRVRVNDGGAFSTTLILHAGRNEIILTPTPDADHPRAQTYIVHCTAEWVDLQVTLTWDRDNTDLDLHVIEPTGNEIYWRNRIAPGPGGYLDHDNTTGYGPESYRLPNRNHPEVPTGTYEVRVAYFAGEPPVNFTVALTWKPGQGDEEATHRFHGSFERADSEHRKPVLRFIINEEGDLEVVEGLE